MSDLKTSLRAFGMAASAITDSSGLKQLHALEKLDAERVEIVIGRAGERLRPLLRQMLISNYLRSGIRTRTGTLLRALANPLIESRLTGIKVSMPSGIQYPPRSAKNGKSRAPTMGNVYAAAGVMRYGGIRVNGGHSLSRTSKARKRIKRALAGAGQTKNSAGTFTYVAPRDPFFKLTSSDLNALAKEWHEAVRDGLRTMGIKVA